MRERPILFSAPMVRAILDGRKTQTRRLCAKANDAGPADAVVAVGENSWIAGWGRPGTGGWASTLRSLHSPGEGFRCPYGVPGDRLWVRETWYDDKVLRESEPRPTAPDEYLIYRADGEPSQQGFEDLDGFAWRPSIHMPRWASRLTLEVTGVRVERVQDISEEDAQLEGVDRPVLYDPSEGLGVRVHPYTGNYRDAFAELWDRINGKRAPWSSNPWVFVIDFRRIDAKERAA